MSMQNTPCMAGGIDMEHPSIKHAGKTRSRFRAVGLLGVVACFASRIVRWVRFPHGPPNFASRVCAVDTLR